MKVLKESVEEEFKDKLEKIKAAALISSNEVIEESKLWFGYDITSDNNDDSNMCYDFIKAVDFTSSHVEFIKDNWDVINEVFGIIKTKLISWYTESLNRESISELTKYKNNINSVYGIIGKDNEGLEK